MHHPAAAGSSDLCSRIEKNMSELSRSATWQALQKHQKAMAKTELRDMFADDPRRFKKFSLQFDDILFDYSKNLVNEDTLQLLFKLAKEAHLEQHIQAMFAGEKINFTENRAVLHVALRNRSNH
jgi:glucose-6-phosphate isomerase